MIFLAGLVIICEGLKAVSWIVGPVFLVVTLIISVQPLRGWLVRRGWPRLLGSIVALLTVYAALLLVLGCGGLVHLAAGGHAAAVRGRPRRVVDQVVDGLTKIGVNQAVVTDALSSGGLTNLTHVLTDLLSAVSGGATILLLIFAMVWFLAFDGAGIGERLRWSAGTVPRSPTPSPTSLTASGPTGSSPRPSAWWWPPSTSWPS